MDVKKYTFLLVSLFLFFLLIIGGSIYCIDPYFHYHRPHKAFFYMLNNERSQNDGILRNFEYNAILTGTSLSQNFKTSDVNQLFHVNCVKVTFSGSTFKEINDSLARAFRYKDDIKLVIRDIHYGKIMENKDLMREDLGEYPTYLYDDNFYNDVKYLLNKDVLLNRCGVILHNYFRGGKGGITSFDQYSNWMKRYEKKWGKDFVLRGRKHFNRPRKLVRLSNEEKQTIIENVQQNIVDIAQAHPETEFYYFIAPPSIVYWGIEYERGKIDYRIEAERIFIENILSCGNIKLYSYNDDFRIVTDLDNYKDLSHYGEWINSYILEQMKAGKGLISKDNYKAYLERERNFYNNYDYKSLLK